MAEKKILQICLRGLAERSQRVTGHRSPGPDGKSMSQYVPRFFPRFKEYLTCDTQLVQTCNVLYVFLKCHCILSVTESDITHIYQISVYKNKHMNKQVKHIEKYIDR